MKMLLIEPYYTGSHKQWADGYQKYSQHKIRILSMKGQFWKWRMHGGAVTLARKFNNMKWGPDLILATDMLDLTTFLSLTREKSHNIPTAIYFHENQLSYPWSPKDRDIQKNRDNHYRFINYASALAADRVFFNSDFHMNSFLDALRPFLKHFPDHNELDSVNIIRNKSSVLHLGMDLQRFDGCEVEKEGKPVILWNHRWEYDKNPELFFSVLRKVKNDGYNFQLIVLGENFSQSPVVFEQAKNIFKNEIVQWGYTKSFDEYAEWLRKADILPVTSNQEFFGASVVEAIYCGTWPILPNRLAYPELLPKELHQQHLYSTEIDLYNKIIWTIDNYKKVRSQSFSSLAEQFDWETIKISYDSLFFR